MMIVDEEVNRVLTLLRNKIREQGFTQLQVQEALSWGRSYISQLLTKQKSLRVEQVLLILGVIGVDPAEFFAELYFVPRAGVFRQPVAPQLEPRRAPQAGEEIAGTFEEMRSLVRGLVWLLVDKEMIDVDELGEAVKARKEGTESDRDDGLTN